MLCADPQGMQNHSIWQSGPHAEVSHGRRCAPVVQVISMLQHVGLQTLKITIMTSSCCIDLVTAPTLTRFRWLRWMMRHLRLNWRHRQMLGHLHLQQQ